MGRQLQNKKQRLLHKNLSVQVSVLNLSWHDNLTAYYSSEPVLQWQLQQTRAPDLQPILAGCGTVAGGSVVTGWSVSPLLSWYLNRICNDDLIISNGHFNGPLKLLSSA